MDITHLFSPFTLRSVAFKNRIVVSPMCQYSSEDGFANDWHLVHLGSRAVGGAACVFTEATAVTPEGRISPEDLGIWSDAHIPFLSRIAEFISTHGAIPAMQIAHAGRKGSTLKPWEGNGKVELNQGGWEPVAPSPIPFAQNYPSPRELNIDDIQALITAFVSAAQRACKAGFKVLEIHGAHGYLIHEFLSPLSNHRTDQYGGTFENRIRFLLEVVRAVRTVWPAELPLFVRLSATDWTQGGWDIAETIRLCALLKNEQVDLIDVSSGGMTAQASAIPVGPGYQTTFAERVKHEAHIPTGAVGFIISPLQADHIIRTEQADMVFLARELLRDPYWPLRAAKELKHATTWPSQYLRAAPH